MTSHERNGVANYQEIDCLFNSFSRMNHQRSTLSVLRERNPPATGGFSSQNSSNAENVSMSCPFIFLSAHWFPGAFETNEMFPNLHVICLFPKWWASSLYKLLAALDGKIIPNCFMSWQRSINCFRCGIVNQWHLECNPTILWTPWNFRYFINNVDLWRHSGTCGLWIRISAAFSDPNSSPFPPICSYL